MKILAITVLLSAALATAFTQDEPAQAKAEPQQHAWLLQMVGEWDVSSEAVIEPGTEAIRWNGSETVRSIGKLWIVAEGNMVGDGQSASTIMTLGYDPDLSSFVGSWVDSMHTTMWSYRGKLDSEQHILTLETEGPSFNDPAKVSKYRDCLELLDTNHKRMTSMVQAAGGTWRKYMTANYHRRK